VLALLRVISEPSSSDLRLHMSEHFKDILNCPNFFGKDRPKAIGCIRVIWSVERLIYLYDLLNIIISNNFVQQLRGCQNRKYLFSGRILLWHPVLSESVSRDRWRRFRRSLLNFPYWILIRRIVNTVSWSTIDDEIERIIVNQMKSVTFSIL